LDTKIGQAYQPVRANLPLLPSGPGGVRFVMTVGA